MKWRCKQEHEWDARFSDLKNNHSWCPFCAGLRILDHLGIAQGIAKAQGGRCLATVCENVSTPIEFECKNLHRWFATLNNVKDAETWCKICAGKQKYTLEDVVTFALTKNWQCLSVVYIDCDSKLVWHCAACDCTWETSFYSVKHDKTSCACGGNLSKNQLKILNMLRKFLGYDILVNYKDFDWLRTFKTGKQELDLFVLYIKLAVEYDGEQHFKSVSIFGGDAGFEKQQRLDVIKNQKIAEHPEDVKYFARINYMEPITEGYLLYKLVDAGVPLFYLIGGMNTWK
jgi:hypothetical protein